MTLFETRQPFREEYEPDTIVARDETIAELGSIFQDFIDGFRVPHLFVRGDRGTGKRTAVRHILNLAELEVENEINVITIDCGEHSSLHQIYLELVYQLHEADLNGSDQSDLEKALFQQMDDPNTTWYFILENLEALGKHDLPFHEIQEAITEYGTNHTECGVIGLSNSTGLHEYLSGKVLHKPYMYTLKTNPYDATDLQQILQHHAEVAFTDDGLSTAVIPKCAAIIAQETGSATEALQLLELSGYIAEKSDADQVTETHVQTASESRDALNWYTTFTEDLRPKEQVIYTIIAAHTEVNEKPVTTKSLVKEYQDHCASFDLQIVQKRRIEQLLVNLREKGLVHAQEKNTGSNDGRWLLHETAAPPRLILRSANATSGRFTRLLRKYNVSIDNLRDPDEIDIEEFLSDNWSPQDSDIDLQNLDFYPS